MDSLTDILGHDFTTAINKTKVCGICKEDLPVSHFGKDGGANYLRYECKSCAKDMAKTLTAIKKTAPLVPVDYVCPICKLNAKDALGHNKTRKSPWCADHNHETGEFRGWLCHKCNLGLGNFGDIKQRLLNAVAYLEQAELAAAAKQLPALLFDWQRPVL